MKIAFKFLFSLSFFFFLLSACFFIPSLFSQEKPKEALFYEKLANKLVQCRLCPHNCAIPDKKRGFCRTRENQGGILYALDYARAVAIHIDPIEKKPLFHFFPGATAYSIATAGCNLRCKFCQNWEISQSQPDELDYTYLEPEELVRRAKASGSPIIAYTYSEPVIFYEYMLDCAKLARKEGLKNIMHSNGYINEQPLRQLCKYLDGANVDLKGFSEEYYAKLCEGSLAPVLNSLKILKEEGVYTEITTLILPGFNDDEPTFRKMCLWIKDNLGQDTPLHLSRFFPLYKLSNLSATPPETLRKLRQIALDSGLRYVYIGNLPGGAAEDTYCPACKKPLIERRGYFILENNTEDGKCKYCGEKISGVWK